ncbi:hypothetical protein [Henriciella aquimarina]|uniref:hypothetical protein n=1 Tax=Henriciella aquimarina TaxID=545261 RepID=UPI000A0027FE|nr:hypothetical protein [Henriciella aquimarina]
MKHHAILIASATALLTACGPGNSGAPPPSASDDVTDPAPQGPATSDSADEAAADAENTGNSENGDSEPFETAQSEFDIQGALSGSVAEGEWFTQPNWTGFGPPNSEALFMVRCGEYGMIRLTRMTDIDESQPARAVIAAGNESEEGYWKAEQDAELPSADFEIYAEAPVFDAMMDADKIAVLTDGKPALVIPGDPQLDEQIDSCRNQGSGTP